MVSQSPAIVPRFSLLAADEATQFLTRLVSLRSLVVAQSDHGQLRPPLPVTEVLQAIEHQVMTILLPAVSSFFGLIDIVIDPLEVHRLGVLQGRQDVPVQMLLV